MKAARAKEWTEAQRRCGLSDTALAMAKELGLAPHSLVKNIPHRSQPWKAPVEAWVRGLHEEKFSHRRAAAPATSSPPADSLTAAFNPPPPEPPPHVVNEIDAAREALFARLADGELDEAALTGAMDRIEHDTPVSLGEIDDDNTRNRFSASTPTSLSTRAPPSVRTPSSCSPATLDSIQSPSDSVSLCLRGETDRTSQPIVSPVFFGEIFLPIESSSPNFRDRATRSRGPLSPENSASELDPPRVRRTLPFRTVKTWTRSSAG